MANCGLLHGSSPWICCRPCVCPLAGADSGRADCRPQSAVICWRIEDHDCAHQDIPERVYCWQAGVVVPRETSRRPTRARAVMLNRTGEGSQKTFDQPSEPSCVLQRRARGFVDAIRVTHGGVERFIANSRGVRRSFGTEQAVGTLGSSITGVSRETPPLLVPDSDQRHRHHRRLVLPDGAVEGRSVPAGPGFIWSRRLRGVLGGLAARPLRRSRVIPCLGHELAFEDS
jgi:hypothetical protein